MEHKQIIGLEKKEIENISGKGISFKNIRIPNEDCSFFIIRYEIVNQVNNSKFSSPINLFPSIYQRDVSQVTLSKSILIPDDCKIYIQIEPILKKEFKGTVFIDYEVFMPDIKLKNKPGMKVLINESDRQNAYRIALTNLARFFGIPNWEYEDNKTLYGKIKEVNDPIIDLLKKYFKAYNEWFGFYARIKEEETKTGQERDLTKEERNELAGLIKNRDSTLNALQTKFDELQFDRFKKSHGLGNIDGIIQE